MNCYYYGNFPLSLQFSVLVTRGAERTKLKPMVCDCNVFMGTLILPTAGGFIRKVFRSDGQETRNAYRFSPTVHALA